MTARCDTWCRLWCTRWCSGTRVVGWYRGRSSTAPPPWYGSGASPTTVSPTASPLYRLLWHHWAHCTGYCDTHWAHCTATEPTVPPLHRHWAHCTATESPLSPHWVLGGVSSPGGVFQSRCVFQSRWWFFQSRWCFPTRAGLIPWRFARSMDSCSLRLSLGPLAKTPFHLELT